MKKTYLIIGGVSAILLLLAIWVYLLIYGTPKPVENFFTDFSFSGQTTDNTPVETFTPPETGDQVNIDAAKLRQLTTRPVIGMGEYTDTTISSNNVFIRYAEAGTGHIYAINIITGEEVRISNNTIAGASRAVFSPNGQYVAIESGYSGQNNVTLVTLLGGNTATTKLLTQKMVDFSFSDENELMYSEYTSSGQTASKLNLDTSVSRAIFSVPFQSVTIIWSTNDSTPHYVYPKASTKLSGYLYKIQNGTILRQNVAGPGLTVEANKGYYISTTQVSNTPRSYSFNIDDQKRRSLPIVVEPTKCAPAKLDQNILYCGSDSKGLNYEFPDNWYKGLISFSDKIWRINLDKGYATQLISPMNEAGREIDVINMSIGQEDRFLYFINKNDNTLWMYEI